MHINILKVCNIGFLISNLALPLQCISLPLNKWGGGYIAVSGHRINKKRRIDDFSCKPKINSYKA